MRTPRIKISPAEGEAFYHCISRTINGERILADTDKEVLRRQIHTTADYCGVQIITYAILSNHFHILVAVPPTSTPTDAELLRRYHVMYPKPNPYQTANIEFIEEQMETTPDAPEVAAWRRRQLALMGDVSQFMKLLKQRFSIYFNKNHNRYGHLWSERFKSVLIEGRSGSVNYKSGHALETVAAYIDLNPVRAGLATDPKDYRFCGYAEAVAGNTALRTGLSRVAGDRLNDWRGTHANYRELLFGKGSVPKGNAASLTPEQLDEVIRTHGKLPLHVLLRCRLRYLTDGAVLGSESFVQKQIAIYRARNNLRRASVPRPFPTITDWFDASASALATLRAPRKAPASTP